MNMLKSASPDNRRSELLFPCAKAFAKIFASACVMAALAVVAPAYAAPAAGEPEPAPAVESATTTAAPIATLDRIRSAGRLVLGYRADAAPMSSRDPSGQPAGYSVALCNKVADALKDELSLPSLAVEWVAVSAGYADIEQHNVDLICAADAVTLAHRAVVSFSIPVFPGGTAALLRDDAPDQLQRALEERPPPYQPLWRGMTPQSLQALQRKTVSVVGGTEVVELLTARMAALKINSVIAPVDSCDAGVAKVLERSSDVFFGDRAQLLDLATHNAKAKDLKVLARHFTFEPLALALQRNDDDFRLVVDRALSAVYRNPEFGAIYSASFGPVDAETTQFFRMFVAP
jgi:ABC-type amino acid transport substrate-binding protein